VSTGEPRLYSTSGTRRAVRSDRSDGIDIKYPPTPQFMSTATLSLEQHDCEKCNINDIALHDSALSVSFPFLCPPIRTSVKLDFRGKLIAVKKTIT